MINGDDYVQVKSQHSFLSVLYLINKTCRILQLHTCYASFIISYLDVKPAIRDTSDSPAPQVVCVSLLQSAVVF